MTRIGVSNAWWFQLFSTHYIIGEESKQMQRKNESAKFWRVQFYPHFSLIPCLAGFILTTFDLARYDLLQAAIEEIHPFDAEASVPCVRATKGAVRVEVGAMVPTWHQMVQWWFLMISMFHLDMLIQLCNCMQLLVFCSLDFSSNVSLKKRGRFWLVPIFFFLLPPFEPEHIVLENINPKVYHSHEKLTYIIYVFGWVEPGPNLFVFFGAVGPRKCSLEKPWRKKKCRWSPEFLYIQQAYTVNQQYGVLVLRHWHYLTPVQTMPPGYVQQIVNK